jgi:predicted MFS family arabinose efflux permease
VTANFVFGQRAIFSLRAEFRGRLNGLYMAIFFAGGAAGSALGGWSYAHGGWSLSMWAGLGLPVLALGFYFTERKPKNGHLGNDRSQNGCADD